jgi:phage terminase large subunit-like protein
MTSRLRTAGGSPKDRERAQAAPKRPRRAAKSTGRVSFERKVSNLEAGRIRRARELLKAQPPGPMPWEDASLSRLQKVLAFIGHLPITKGALRGTQMRLLPFQVELLEQIYGADPQPKLAIQSLPRGNGKTALVAALVVCHALGPEAEPRGEIYSVAVTQNQAAIVHAEAAAIIRAVPSFSARCAITEQRKRIEVLEGVGAGTVYASLAADHGPALGLAPTLWVYDEMGSTKDRRLFDALLSASGKRTNTLGVIISTQAEADDHHLSVLIDAALAGRAPGTVCQVIAAPTDADPFDLETIRACNPACGHYLNETDLIVGAEMAKQSYAQEPSYRRYRLNQRVRTDGDARLIDAATWNRGAVPVIEANLVGKPCTCGFDSAAKHDLVAFLMAFPGPNGFSDILCRFWTPLGQLPGRRPGERELFEQWIRAGYLIGVPGDIVDPAWVLRGYRSWPRVSRSRKSATTKATWTASSWR